MVGEPTETTNASALRQPTLIGEASTTIAHTIAGLFFTYSLWSASQDPTTFWSGSFIVLPIVLVSGIALFRKHAPLPKFLISALAGLSSLAWIVSLIVWFPLHNAEQQLAIVFAVCGGAIALALAFHTYLPALIASVLTPIPCLALLLSIRGDHHVSLSAFLLVYWALLFWLSFRLNVSARQRSALQTERAALIENIAIKAKQLEAAQIAETEARKEAELANNAKSRFLAQSSHDLRQPLHAMSLVLETLPTEHESVEVGDVVSRVKQSLNMLTQLFDSLLDLTLLDTGHFEVRGVPFSAYDLLTQVRDDFSSTAASNNVLIKVAPTRLWLHSDPVILRRIVQNLLSNAIRHTNQGKVLIGVRKQKEQVVLDVLDNGPGIAKEDQARVFGEFTTLGAATGTNNGDGLGLGLAIVQRMATALGLVVSVTSEVGVGSRFRISNIPQASPSEAPPQSNQKPTRKSYSPTGRIAVFDDDRDTLNATSALLEKWGFSVDAYEKWPSTLADQPDILICDYQLGSDATGLDIVRDIRQNTQRDIPALIVTGADIQKIKDDAIVLNLPILSKPVAPAQLRSAILSALVKGD